MDFAEVVLNLPVRRGFHYRIPDALRGRVVPGTRVQVPFGPRTQEGTCVRLHERCPLEPAGPIAGVLEGSPAVPDELLELTRWVSERYLSSWGQALACAMPAGIRRAGRRRVWMARALERLGEAPEPVARLREAGGSMKAAALKVPRSRLQRLAREGWLMLEQVEPEVEIPGARLFSEPEPEALTADQRAALDRIEPALDTHRVFLLDGVTASGKTEVYIRAIRRVLERGRQAILLLPEISLTTQMIGRLTSRLGPVALMHSRVGDAARARQWRAAAAGRIPVVLGARSAVFTPLPKPGLIILDEEHDASYKEHDPPRYHAREVAIERARRAGVPVILGSATPSIESMARARRGEAEHLKMPRRVHERPMPAVEIVSRADERGPGLVSDRLRREMERALAGGHQVILYLNRRGYATCIRCRRCGWMMRCARCAVLLTVHQREARAVCHYCLHSVRLPSACADCGTPAPERFGAGTEKVEEEVARLFPKAGLLRMDTDAMKGRHALEEALRRFRDGEANILIGTKMVAKGLHFPNVTLVGVISADTAFHLLDFRCAETTFQELTHVMGRSGRGEHPGRVLIQTFHPTHYSVTTAAARDYDAFYERELAERRDLGYPPHGELVRLLFEGADAAAVDRLARVFTEALARQAGLAVLGPVPAPVARLRGRVRVHSLVKAADGAAARRAIGELMERVPLRGGVELAVDVDPYESA